MTGQITVRVRRIYGQRTPDDGARVLVDRLWPRGLTKDQADLDDWCRVIAPSTALRRWYAHDRARFPEFARRYRAELARPEQAAELKHLLGVAQGGALTLLTATKDVDISEAAVLADLLGAENGRSTDAPPHPGSPASRG
jgi:uncharacterized protein YeaO (DUF488 family)